MTHRVRQKKDQPTPRQISLLASSAWISTGDAFAHIVGRVAKLTDAKCAAQRFLEFRCNSMHLPGFVISAEVIFGMPDQTLTTRHDSGSSARPYIDGALLAIRRVSNPRGVHRGLDPVLGLE